MTHELKTPVDVLRAARKLIEKEENWTRGTFARDGVGMDINPWSPNAKCFCDIGAVMCVSETEQLARESVRYLAKSIPIQYRAPLGDDLSNAVSDYNDTNSHARNVALFDKAITLAERDYASAS
jgi:hypothetical protein